MPIYYLNAETSVEEKINDEWDDGGRTRIKEKDYIWGGVT